MVECMFLGMVQVPSLIILLPAVPMFVINSGERFSLTHFIVFVLFFSPTPVIMIIIPGHEFDNRFKIPACSAFR